MISRNPFRRNLNPLIVWGGLLFATVSQAQFDFNQEGYRWNPDNSHVYRLTPVGMPWNDARVYAKDHTIGSIPIPGDLVTIRSQAENDWLSNPDTNLLSPLSRRWIGMTDDIRFSTSGIWRWVSGEPGVFDANDRSCSRYCNFAPDTPSPDSPQDYAVIQNDDGNFSTLWFSDVNEGSNPDSPWYGIVEFIPPFVGAYDDTDGNQIPESWEDNNSNGVPDGFEEGGPFPAPRNLRAGGGVGSIRLVWDPADSPDLLGYDVFRADSPLFTNQVKINTRGFVLDPFFLDEFEDRGTTPPGTEFFYRVESILRIQGRIVRGLSEIVSGIERQFVVDLLDINAFPAPGEGVKFPISVLNARGMVSSGFEIHVLYPDSVLSVSAERTALTKDFPVLQVLDDPDKNIVTIQTDFSTDPEIPLNGEGSLIDLEFTFAGAIPIGARGEVRVLQAFFHIAPGETGGRDLSDIGSITKSPLFRPGDVNGSGQLTFADVVASASLAFGVVPESPLPVAAGDINGDGIVDVADINQIIAILIGKNSKERTPAEKSAPKSKGVGDFEIKLKDTPFESLPGSAEMEVEINMPPAESEGISGAAFTVSYATEYVQLTGVELDGTDFDALFYDQRDYSRGWKPGRVKVIVSSPDNKVINGTVAKVKFNSNGTPPVPSSDVPFVSGKMAKSSGEDISWSSLVELEEGTLIFESPPELDINVFVDNIIDAKDLLIFIDRIKNGTEEGEVLNEFSKEWKTPR
jgi:hypothetical protein